MMTPTSTTTNKKNYGYEAGSSVQHTLWHSDIFPVLCVVIAVLIKVRPAAAAATRKLTSLGRSLLNSFSWFFFFFWCYFHLTYNMSEEFPLLGMYFSSETTANGARMKRGKLIHLAVEYYFVF